MKNFKEEATKVIMDILSDYFWMEEPIKPDMCCTYDLHLDYLDLCELQMNIETIFNSKGYEICLESFWERSFTSTIGYVKVEDWINATTKLLEDKYGRKVKIIKNRFTNY